MRILSILSCLLGLSLPSVMSKQWIFNAMLDGATAGHPSLLGTGMGTVTIDDVTDTMRVQVTFSQLSSTTLMCHIHGPTTVALSGTAGPATTLPTFVGFPIGVHAGTFDSGELSLLDPNTFNTGFISNNGGTASSAAAVLYAALKNSKTYLNIHTSEFQGGEIAGFLIPAASGSGDPQFDGFQGQSFQVHGIPDTIFGIISSPNFQMNSNFAYIGTGGKCDYDNTQCWSHPGTYMDRIGVLMRDTTSGNETRIAITANSHAVGLHVNIDGKKLRYDQYSNNTYIYGNNMVRYSNYDQLTVVTDILQITFTNSDHFINLATSLLRPDWLRLGRKLSSIAKPDESWPHLHGLLGQTWRATSYEQGRQYEGTIDDYVLETQDIFATDFTFNQYQ